MVPEKLLLESPLNGGVGGGGGVCVCMYRKKDIYLLYIYIPTVSEVVYNKFKSKSVIIRRGGRRRRRR